MWCNKITEEYNLLVPDNMFSKQPEGILSSEDIFSHLRDWLRQFMRANDEEKELLLKEDDFRMMLVLGRRAVGLEQTKDL